MTRQVTTMTIDDAPHISPAQRAEIIASYPEHERDARTKGVPSMGSGRVFPVSEEKLLIDPIPIPRHWAQIVGIDFGWDHPFAAVRCAWDRDADCWYVTQTYRESQATPVIHAGSIRPWGSWLPIAWPHDGLQHDKGSGEGLADLYRRQGLALTKDRATYEDGGSGVEAGVLEMLERMQTGRFKVFCGLGDWLGEFRMHHRKDGKIVKERDDLLSATRYAMMMKRWAAVERTPAKPVRVGVANGWLG